MTSDQRILVRRGAALACCFVAFVLLAPGIAGAVVAGSRHDFTGALIPGRSSLAPTGLCSACHIAHGSEPEANWIRSVPLVRSLDEERAYFNQSSNPNYTAGSTILCYDCHDNHTVSGGVDNNPQAAWFNQNRLPQDVAFDADMKTTLPRGTNIDNIPGFYENTPSRSVPPTTTYVSGHFVKTNPGSGTILVGDKLPCSDCHDPHNKGNQAFIRSDLAGKSLSGLVASTKMAYDYAIVGDRNDDLSRDICIACHGTAEQTTFTAVTFSAINPSYGGATIVKPPSGVPEHDFVSTTACTSCHSHNKLNVSCTDCHGTSPTETSPPSGAILGQFWPDGVAVNPLYTYADNEIGAHPRHIEAIAQNIYGLTSAEAVTAGKQIAICGFCHTNPGGGGHDFNDPALPSNLNRVNVRTGLAGDRFRSFTVGDKAYGDDNVHVVGNYNYANRTCSGIDCHYEYATPLYGGAAPNVGWDIADTSGNEPNCRTCHYFRDDISGSGPGATATWTPLTPQLPDAHQTHVGGIAPNNVDQSRNYPCYWCHPIPVATSHANGDIDLSTAGNLTLGKEQVPNVTDELMTPSSLAVKFGVGPLLANTACANMYCHGADFGAVANTETATQGSTVTPIWNSHLTGACGTCHDVDTRDTPNPLVGQTFSEGKHKTHIWSPVNAPYGPPMAGPAYFHECGGCHGVVAGLPVPTVNCALICHPGGFDTPGLPSDAGWASFPSRSHVEGNFMVDFEGEDRGFNFLADYKATPGTLASIGTSDSNGTNICNRCHSTANIVGTTGATLAKQNWITLGYRLNCLTCHNTAVPAWSTPVIVGTAATIAPPKNASWATRGHGLVSPATYPWVPNRSGASLVCTSCHNSTSTHINGTLTEDRLTTPGNALCTNCHDGTGPQPGTTQVSTHGNRSTTMTYSRQRPAFELNCSECHEVHGSTNIFMVNTVNSNGPLVSPRFYNGLSNLTTFLFQPAAVVVFGPTNTTGLDYAATVANANKICQTCHTVTGDYQFNSGNNGHATTDCTTCHPHDYDDNFDPTNSQDGFMPKGECKNCHNAASPFDPGGGKPVAPGIDMTIWVSSGHGKATAPAVICTDCHNIDLPSPNTHWDGTLNSRFYFGKSPDTRNANTSHLVSGYLAGANNPSAKQVGFDDYCYNTCHVGKAKENMRHSYTKDLVTGNVGIDLVSRIMEFNTAYTTTNNPKQDRGADNVWTPWTISDLTNVAGVNANPPTVRHNGVCVSCHNPHGTSTIQKTRNSNHMVIRNWQDIDMPAFCQSNCHIIP